MTRIDVHLFVGETSREGLCEEDVGKLGTAISGDVSGLCGVIEGFEIDPGAWGEGFVSHRGDHDDSGGLGGLKAVEDGHREDEVAILCHEGRV